MSTNIKYDKVRLLDQPKKNLEAFEAVICFVHIKHCFDEGLFGPDKKFAKSPVRNDLKIPKYS